MNMTAIEIERNIGQFEVIHVDDGFDVSPVWCDCWGRGADRDGPFELQLCDQHFRLGGGKPAVQIPTFRGAY